ncbi:unnamed protein product [Penicillium olsonii]|uniref:Uncharacterized protein n=1 Tax=Penicillium olsonii TaxID=99116 RepID=A0A9W4MSK5_PENOL|nr:unnamed protein product [Penicillium olsonii]CAG8223751.1 unnamed protein product [Penicillium olsonii]
MTESPNSFDRRNSTLSDSISEARNSIRSSTDDLFLPRVSKGHDVPEESHWHSTPLGLALLPAIAGVFFQNGSSIVTDVTLLVLAAIFLNWSVRLPWDWYRSAQATRSGLDDQTPFEEDSSSEAAAARKELQTHELAALTACFVFPVIGTWLLHAIRGSLSRPSEGLVSNYNLTIFLLASEVRPIAHLLRLIQKRTLYLQRIVTSSPPSDPSTLADLTKRLEELEAHVAETATREKKVAGPETDSSLVSQAVAEIRKSIQPDIEALNRAVRRYEKRSSLFALQTDQRFVRLEAQAGDAIALAAAAQRSQAARSGYALVLLEWVCAFVVVPVQIGVSAVGLPGRLVAGSLDAVKGMLGFKGKSKARPKGKTVAGSSSARQGGSAQRRPMKSG